MKRDYACGVNAVEALLEQAPERVLQLWVTHRRGRVEALLERARKLGAADAGVITLVEGERARGFELKTAAFGDPAAFVLWEFADQLAEKLAITILHAGPGTLWTDMRRAGMGELGGAAILQQGAAEK